VAQARSEAFRLASYCSRYRRQHDRWPSSQELVEQRDDLPPIDPWGRPYRVRVLADADAAEVRSTGGDGVSGTCDDVVSPRATIHDVAPRY